MMVKIKKLLTLALCFFSLISGTHSQESSINLRKANKLLSVAQERNRLVTADLEEVKSYRQRLEEDLTDLLDNPNGKAERKKIEVEIKDLRKKEADLLQRRKYANNLLLDVTEILQASDKSRSKFIQEYEKRFGPIKVEGVVVHPVVTTAAPPSVETVQTKPAKADPIAQLENQAASPPSVSVENNIVDKKNTKSESKKEEKATAEAKAKKEKGEKAITEANAKKEKEAKAMIEAKAKKEAKAIAEAKTKQEKEAKRMSESKSKKKKDQQPNTESEPKPTATEAITTPQDNVFPTIVEPKKDNSTAVPTAQTDVVATAPEPQKDITTANAPLKTKPQKPKKEKKPAVEKASTESSKTGVNYKKFDIKQDPLYNSPSTLDCNLAFDGIDNFTGKKKQETTPIVLFAHTDDFMKATLKDKEFVTCEATATRVEGSRVIYLNLTITIQSKDAQRAFGFLDRESLIIFRFINGKKVNLKTNKTDIGVVDPEKGTTTFRAQLVLAETVELTLSELDAIRVSWSVGYEDYEIFDMDVLRNMFKCLDKK